MIKIGLRDARAHFGRFVMSIIAIALGVSFVVGSFCFREMMNNQVSDMIKRSQIRPLRPDGRLVFLENL